MSDSGQEAGGEAAIVAARREKAERVRGRGQSPFANDIATEDRTLVAELRALCSEALIEPRPELRYDPERVAGIAPGRVFHLMGRLVARRGFGKASFLRLRDGSGELQVFAKKDVLGDGFAALEDIDIADHIEARGSLMVTRTGELSLQVTSIRLLTKALRPLPDKWHGLTDVDARYRHRYVDMVANPDVGVVLRARSFVIQGLRDFLDHQGFIEVETPTLHTLVGGAAARPFVTHHNTLDMQLFLRIAPELYLKRLLVGGFERVYEIGRCYRNEGLSTRHNPEFTMLELYRAYATYETLMDMTEQMLRHVDGFVGERLGGSGLGEHYERWCSARPFTFAEPFVRVPMREAIQRAVEAADLPADLPDHLAALGVAPGGVPGGEGNEGDRREGDRSEGDRLVARYREVSARARVIDWVNLRKGLGVCDSDGERTFVAYEYLAEAFLPEDYRSADGSQSVPVFILDYPAEVSPLARRKDADPTLTDRFELFVHGRELCNAFSELNDPDDQASRFQQQVEKKRRGDEETMDYDEDYVRALEHGMPPAAGFGLGVDRLVMMLAAQPSIRDVVAFPLLRPESPSR